MCFRVLWLVALVPEVMVISGTTCTRDVSHVVSFAVELSQILLFSRSGGDRKWRNGR